MTKKFVGHFQLATNEDNTFKDLVLMRSAEKLPPKEKWNEFSIYEFNGKIYKPVTKKAKENLDELVKRFQDDYGYTKAIKDGKHKPSSIRYAIQTYGVEPSHIV